MSTTAKKEKVSTFFRPIKAITVTHIKQMYDIYSSFYENTSLDIFLNDLSKKSGVILVTRKSDDRIVGFSTQTFFDLKVDGKRVKFEFTMLCAPIPLRIATCTLMKECLEKIGILCNIRPVERTVLQQRLLDHEYESAFGGWGTGADPSTLDNIFETGQ